MATYNGLSEAQLESLSALQSGEYYYSQTRGSYYHQDHQPGLHKVIDRRTMAVLVRKGLIESGFRIGINQEGLKVYREARRQHRAKHPERYEH
jgi:hypothetical protein